MDFEQEDSTRERLFVLRLMDFVYKLTGRPLQYCLQQKLDEYPKSRESYFSENITQAIMIYIKDFRSSDINLVDLASPAYQNKMEELSKIYDSFYFLKFLAHYSWKSADEYYNNKLLDSPAKFFSSIVRFLEEMRKAGRCDDNFWGSLEAASTRVIARDLEVIKSENRNFKDVSEDETMASEREFILEVMRMVSRAYRKPLPPYLSDAFEEFMFSSTFEYDQNLETALDMAIDSLERSVCRLGSDDGICLFFYRSCKTDFKARDFLEYCVCSTRKALFEYYENSKYSPQKAYDRLFSLVQTAKKAGKYNSVQDFIDGAHDIIVNERDMNAAFQRQLNDVSTNLYSDVSEESNSPDSDIDKMIAKLRCDCKNIGPGIYIGPGKDTKNKSPRKKTKLKKIFSKPATKNVTSPGKKLQPPKGNAILPKEKVESAIEKATLSDQNLQSKSGEDTKIKSPGKQTKLKKIVSEPATKNVTSPGKRFQPPKGNAILPKEKVELAIEKATLSDQNLQSAKGTLSTSDQNAHLAIDTAIVKENSQLTIKKATASDENSQRATGTSENNPQSAIEKAISKEIAQTIDNVTISGENAQAVETVATKEYTKPAYEDTTIPGENTQSAAKKITFGENAQLAFDSLIISSERAHSSSEKAVTSSDSNRQASESQNLMASCEHRKNSCKCCKNCCTTT